MSIPTDDRQSTIFDAFFAVKGLFKATDRYRLFRERILPSLRRGREKLTSLYCAENGRPAIEPVVMAGVTLLQFMEKLPDRRAVEQLKLHIGWKYALDLPMDYAGFDSTSLVRFRKRLLGGGAERVVFDAILGELQASGLVKQKRKERIDSTHIVGSVSRMSRLEVVRETIRLFLEELEKRKVGKGPGNWPELIDRYVEGSVDYWRLGTDRLREKTKQAGVDMRGLVEWVSRQPEWVQGLARSQLLVRVYHEQYEEGDKDEGSGPELRSSEESGTVKNPHDPEVQWAAKDPRLNQQWEGYKVQVVESIPEGGKESGEPTDGFITEITTTEALESDVSGMESALAAQEAHGVGNGEELHADAGYITDDTLAAAKDAGRELVGPARPAPTNGVLGVEGFDVDMEQGRAVCPGGKVSTRYRVTPSRRHGQELHQFEWGEQCDACPLQGQCTRSRSGRRKLTVGRHHAELQRRRREMATEEFQEKLKLRAGIEGTISELVRGYDLRRTRYRGLTKTRLRNYLIGAACNTNRWLRRVGWALELQGQTA